MKNTIWVIGMKVQARAVSAVVGACLTGMIWTGAAWAEPVWVQVEAKSSLADAQQRASEWAGEVANVAGFQMSTGWYAIALGPFDTEAEADEARREMRRNGQIPADAYVTDGGRFRQQFWPVGANLTLATPESPEAEPTQPEAPELIATAEPSPSEEPVETLAESRRFEAGLSRDELRDIQSALEWEGSYSGAIDGLFGRGTRASIADWQGKSGFEQTGVLATSQYYALMDKVAAAKAAYGFETVDETESGIRITLPTALVEFDHYDPPFVHFREKNGSGLRILLISQQGDQAHLSGLYDAMQTLEIVPMDGPRSRDRAGFTLTGENARIRSHTEASLKNGLIKGFTLVYPTEKQAEMARVLQAMQQSYAPIGSTALDDTLGQPLAVSPEALMAGLNVRKPVASHSGFYTDAQGTVLTARSGFETCGRVTIEDHDATVALRDAALGIAVLKPDTPLAPVSVAAFGIDQPVAGSAVAVAGFSYPEALSAPVLSFGTLSDLSGLAGEADQARLAVATLDGDVGGPVLDATGSVIGVLMARPEDGSKLLPDDLSLAVQAMSVVPVLAENGLAPVASDRSGALAAEDLAELADGMVVQVACWN
ncbi:SPOR domain-containing protein [Thioclava sp. A2]|uniref:trypsin-like peptidase domain-containing protein n=1 Tax=Thioclava sp. FCG-A2 TaxID=3080562 RepID=UPI0029539DC5|nr:trypsin-like peptidase domain-containing protein [Thioclava sp. A2]MDV7270224.1 SPOR domain-containing protein [Thioclava sp. A2]